jgi:hypothetical protein
MVISLASDSQLKNSIANMNQVIFTSMLEFMEFYTNDHERDLLLLLLKFSEHS